MRFSSAAILGLLVSFAGCNSAKKTAAVAQRTEQAQQTEIDHRAATVAAQLAQQAVQDEEAKHAQEAQQANAAREKLRQTVLNNPASILDVGALQMVDKGGFRHLGSVALTNNSKFSVSDVHGTLDFHGELDRPGSNSDVLAMVPIDLTGSIAAGASMVFSEQQKTLSGASIQLPKPPHHVTFTVTGVGSVGTDMQSSLP